MSRHDQSPEFSAWLRGLPAGQLRDLRDDSKTAGDHEGQDQVPASYRALVACTPRATCVREDCGRPIGQRASDGAWVHIAPDGHLNRTCRSAAFDDPKPGDEERRDEWGNWPRKNRSIAYPGAPARTGAARARRKARR